MISHFSRRVRWPIMSRIVMGRWLPGGLSASARELCIQALYEITARSTMVDAGGTRSSPAIACTLDQPGLFLPRRLPEDVRDPAREFQIAQFIRLNQAPVGTR